MGLGVFGRCRPLLGSTCGPKAEECLRIGTTVAEPQQ